MKEHLIEFTQLAMANSEGSDDMLNRVMPKDNIGLAALLKTKEAAWDNGKFLCPAMRHGSGPAVCLHLFVSRITLGSESDPSAHIGVHRSHPLGPGVLRCEIDTNNDAVARNTYHSRGS